MWHLTGFSGVRVYGTPRSLFYLDAYSSIKFVVIEGAGNSFCAVDGYALGGGLEITMASDFVIATERVI